MFGAPSIVILTMIEAPPPLSLRTTHKLGPQMGWKHPSFIKFLLCPDFADNLPIPPLFVSKYLDGRKTTENPILVVYDSAKSYSWPVTIMNMSGGRYCFKLGWSEFCQDNHLERGDFLLFWLTGDSTFLVAIYGPSGIQKKITTKPTFTDSVFEVEQVSSDSDTTCKFKNRKVKELERDMPRAAATSMKQLDNPSFKVMINKSSYYRLYIPKLFVEETRILASMRSMVLINAAGREWPVTILQPNSRSLGYVMTSGWSTFRKANNIVIGDTCLIQFLRNEGNIIHVKVLKRKGSTRISRGQNKGQYKTGKEGGRDGLLEAAASVKPLSFKARLGRSSDYNMGLPMWFVRETRLASRRNTLLKDESGCEYPVRIRQRKGYGYDMGTGWNNFRRAIDIEKGDICLFQFFRDESNVIHVKVVDRKRRGASREQRRRGRQALNKNHPRPQ